MFKIGSNAKLFDKVWKYKRGCKIPKLNTVQKYLDALVFLLCAWQNYTVLHTSGKHFFSTPLTFTE